MAKIIDWDSELGMQVERDATEQEEEEIQKQREDAMKPTVPEQIPMWAARSVLIDHNLLDLLLASFEAIVDAKEKRKAKDKFEYSSTMRRDDILVLSMIPVLGLTTEQADALFIEASQL